MPIIDLQRRLTEVGRIRIGQKVPTSNGKTRPGKLDRLRFTSPARHLIDAIAEQLGGQVKPWQAPSGPQFEVITDAKEIPVYVPPQNIDPWYEAWGNGYMQRRCDGEREAKRDVPCMCKPDSRDCKPTTRISLMLADVPGLGVWRLESHGWNAAAELSMLTEMLAQAPKPLPARLLIQPRQQKVLKPDGKVETRDFMVPILLFDVITSRQIQGGADAIAQALTGGAQSALGDGGQRQAIGSAPVPAQAAPPEVESGPRKLTEADVLKQIPLARNVQQLQQLWRDAGSDGALTDRAKAALTAASDALTKPTAPAVEQPPVGEIVEAEIVDDADAEQLWNEVLAASPWPTTSELNAKFKAHQNVEMPDADGRQLAAFLVALKAGEVK